MIEISSEEVEEVSPPKKGEEEEENPQISFRVFCFIWCVNVHICLFVNLLCICVVVLMTVLMVSRSAVSRGYCLLKVFCLY